MPDLFSSIGGWITATDIPAQIREVDVSGLFANGYFLVPFICLIIYIFLTRSFKNLVLIGLGTGLWAFSGSEYVKDVVMDGEFQLGKVWPALAVGIGTIGTIFLMVFGNSD